MDTIQDPTADDEPLADEVQYEKVNIRGLDDLTTDDIKRFAADHFKLEDPIRLEWIDDTSANVIYSSPEAGLQALSAFTQPGTEEDAVPLPAMRLRSAKILSTHPDSVLQVRAATKADRKRPRAYEASRFYLMHPEHDPREKMRRELLSDGGDDYRRRGFDQREHRRRRDRDLEMGFNAGMYDEGDFSSHSSSRVRNRSVSPDGRGRNNSSQLRERSPLHHFRRNEGKELFPMSNKSPGGGGGGGGGAGILRRDKELFPEKIVNRGKELFPSAKSHRRTDAFDAADDTARIPVSFDNNNTHRRPDNGNIELFPQLSSDNNTPDGGISIRGMAVPEQGLSIKGRGSSGVRELFPESHSEKLGGRVRRKKAEEMFG